MFGDLACTRLSTPTIPRCHPLISVLDLLRICQPRHPGPGPLPHPDLSQPRESHSAAFSTADHSNLVSRLIIVTVQLSWIDLLPRPRQQRAQNDSDNRITVRKTWATPRRCPRNLCGFLVHLPRRLLTTSAPIALYSFLPFVSSFRILLLAAAPSAPCIACPRHVFLCALACRTRISWTLRPTLSLPPLTDQRLVPIYSCCAFSWIPYCVSRPSFLHMVDCLTATSTQGWEAPTTYISQTGPPLPTAKIEIRLVKEKFFVELWFPQHADRRDAAKQTIYSVSSILLDNHGPLVVLRGF